MKGVALLASPHQEGNNARLLAKSISGIQQKTDINFNKIWLGNLNIKPCSACDYCQEQQGCRIKDDMAIIYDELIAADIILVAAPLYFNTVPAQLKAVIDRCQVFWAAKTVLEQPLVEDKKRIGGFISTSGQPLTTDRFKYVKGTMDLFFKAIDVKYEDNFFIGNVDEKNLAQRPEILARAKNWGEKLVNIFFDNY